MKTLPKTLSVIALVLLPALAAAQEMSPATRPAADEILYDDPTGNSSATITQILSSAANVPATNTTLANVRRIFIRHDVLIIQWGDTATTLLPRQFVAGIAINRRAPRE